MEGSSLNRALPPLLVRSLLPAAPALCGGDQGWGGPAPRNGHSDYAGPAHDSAFLPPGFCTGLDEARELQQHRQQHAEDGDVREEEEEDGEACPPVPQKSTSPEIRLRITKTYLNGKAQFEAALCNAGQQGAEGDEEEDAAGDLLPELDPRQAQRALRELSLLHRAEETASEPAERSLLARVAERHEPREPPRAFAAPGSLGPEGRASAALTSLAERVWGHCGSAEPDAARCGLFSLDPWAVEPRHGPSGQSGNPLQHRGLVQPTPHGQPGHLLQPGPSLHHTPFFQHAPFSQPRSSLQSLFTLQAGSTLPPGPSLQSASTSPPMPFFQTESMLPLPRIGHPEPTLHPGPVHHAGPVHHTGSIHHPGPSLHSGPSHQPEPTIQSGSSLRAAPTSHLVPSLHSGPTRQCVSTLQPMPVINSDTSNHPGASLQSEPGIQSEPSLEPASSLHSPPTLQSGPSTTPGPSLQVESSPQPESSLRPRSRARPGPKRKGEVGRGKQCRAPMRHIPGDLVWSKVAGHPWWPCVVTSDPNVGSHTRVKEYAKSTVRHYHIVLLGGGVVQRTWVADKSIVPFEGQHQFEQLQGDAPWGGSAVNEASGPKLSKHFSAKVRAQWEEGMAEVAKAQPLSCDERHDAYSRPTCDGAGASGSPRATAPTSSPAPPANCGKPDLQARANTEQKGGQSDHAAERNGRQSPRSSDSTGSGTGPTLPNFFSSHMFPSSISNIQQLVNSQQLFPNTANNHSESGSKRGGASRPRIRKRQGASDASRPTASLRQQQQQLQIDAAKVPPPAAVDPIIAQGSKQLVVQPTTGRQRSRPSAGTASKSTSTSRNRQSAAGSSCKQPGTSSAPVSSGCTGTEAATEGIVSSAAGGAAMSNGKKRQRRVRAPASVKSAAGASVPKRALRKRDRKTSAGRVAAHPEGSKQGDGAQAAARMDATGASAACVVTGEASSAAPAPDPAVSKKKKSNPPPQGSKRSEMALARYNYFCQKHRPQIMRDHADASEEEVELILRAQWDTLSERQKYRYRPPTKPTTIGDEDSGDSAKRQRRPTKKLLESTGDFAEESPRKKSKKDLKDVYHPSSHIDKSRSAGMEDTTSPESYSTPAPPTGPSEVSQLADACKPLKKRNRASAPEASSCPVPLKEKAASGDTGSAQESEVSEEGQVEGPAEDEESADLSLATVSSHKRSERGAGGSTKKESVCQICEKTGELILCEGQCCSAFHLSCLELDTMPSGKFMCSECKSGVHTCFDCKEPGADLKRCLAPLCGKFYHVECVRRLSGTVLEGKGFRCSLHVCLACHISQPDNPRAFRGGRLMRCVRCPVAYHTGDNCIAAGSTILASNSIVCPKHFAAQKGCNHHSHVNVSWCFVCSRGGKLLCCEACPAAFHPECLCMDMPEGSWYCNDCKAGRRPHYRDVVWVKVGSYRWWPAEVCNPRSLPTNILTLRHSLGEFPVRFFGSHDFFWTYQARVFPYLEGDKGSTANRTKGINRIFKQALQEAASRFQDLKMVKAQKEAQENERSQRKPPPYKHVKVNKPVGRVQIYTADLSEIPRCNCKPADESPCGLDSECLNRMLLYECHPTVCPAGHRCHNQCFNKRIYPDAEIFRSENKGWGLRAKANIKKGEFVNEYVGELIDEEECRARIKHAHEHHLTNFYMLTIDKDRIIDAGPKGNFSRFMNHSCQPNCETQKWTVNGDTRVGLFAVSDIPCGTELTFNYNLDCLGNEKTVCMCGAPNCSGFLGVRPKSAVVDKKPKRKYRKRKVRADKVHDSECFRCKDGGELVMCDHRNCTKTFHLACLNLGTLPEGKWECPWHVCDVCGKTAVAFCQICPSSFCKQHSLGALRPSSDGQHRCFAEHEHDKVTAAPAAPPPPTEEPRSAAPEKRRHRNSVSAETTTAAEKDCVGQKQYPPGSRLPPGVKAARGKGEMRAARAAKRPSPVEEAQPYLGFPDVSIPAGFSDMDISSDVCLQDMAAADEEAECLSDVGDVGARADCLRDAMLGEGRGCLSRGGPLSLTGMRIVEITSAKRAGCTAQDLCGSGVEEEEEEGACLPEPLTLEQHHNHHLQQIVSARRGPFYPDLLHGTRRGGGTELCLADGLSEIASIERVCVGEAGEVTAVERVHVGEVTGVERVRVPGAVGSAGLGEIASVERVCVTSAGIARTERVDMSDLLGPDGGFFPAAMMGRRCLPDFSMGELPGPGPHGCLQDVGLRDLAAQEPVCLSDFSMSEILSDQDVCLSDVNMKTQSLWGP